MKVIVVTINGTVVAGIAANDDEADGFVEQIRAADDDGDLDIQVCNSDTVADVVDFARSS